MVNTAQKIPLYTKTGNKTKIKIPFKEEKQIEAEEPTNQIKFVGNLLDFQTNVLNWSQPIEKGIIGLDMGLGKTVITIAIICNRNYNKTIIVLPLSLLNQWKTAFQNFSDIDTNSILIYQGPKRNKLNFDTARIILTTYETVRIDINDELSLLYNKKEQFDCIVLDEAHKIRNNETKVYSACYSLSSHCKSKWLLTGTVIHNQFGDFLSLAEFLGLPDFDASIFEDQSQIQRWKKTYYYRLTKSECNLNLPQKIINEHFLEFDENHFDVYFDLFMETKQLYNKYLNAPTSLNLSFLLSKILRLRQCCNHPDAILGEDYRLDKNLYEGKYVKKFAKVIDIIQKTESDDKILIFSQWDHSLNLLSQCLENEGISYLKYNGKIDINKKNIILADFKKSSCKVLLLTLTSGGVGLDLSHANNVIIMDSWWNPALEEQAVDRVYRIGQTKIVNIHRLYMKDTIEEWLIEMKKQKQLIDIKFHTDNLHYAINKGLLKEILAKHIEY